MIFSNPTKLLFLDTFLKLKLENTRLLVKATCLKKIELRVPNVCIINGIVDEDVMDSIHNSYFRIEAAYLK